MMSRVPMASDGGALAVEIKSDASLVTEFDLAVEDRLRAMIEEAYPAHGIVGEEHGAEREGRSGQLLNDHVERDGVEPVAEQAGDLREPQQAECAVGAQQLPVAAVAGTTLRHASILTVGPRFVRRAPPVRIGGA